MLVGMVGVARATRQRDAVRETLSRSDGFVSAQELHHRLRRSGSDVGLSTVYRQLHRLAADGDADVVVSERDEALYRMCASAEHHHHLICRRCGATVEVSGPEVEQWAREVAAAHGFAELDHSVELFGVCAACHADQR
jgi:Fur family transcriptional regulator, ferric uptake regulator